MLCPSVFLLALVKVWGKRSIGKVYVIHLLMVCGISKLCSVSYAGLQYHAYMALGTQIVLVSGGFNIVVQHPGGATGTWLKSCGTSKTWYADSWVWVHGGRSIFNVSCACLISLHHINDGKISSHVLRPEIV